MLLYNFFDHRNPDTVYLQTEKAAYTYGDISEFVGDFEESYLREELSVIALKIENQAVLTFCMWASLYYKQSFILLPPKLDATLEKSLLYEASCCKVITSTTPKNSSACLIEHITSYQLNAITPNYEKKSPKVGFISSGTTGKPKLIWNTFQQISTSLETTQTHDFMPYTKAKNVLISPFLTHSYGFSALLEYTQGNSMIFIPSNASFAGIFKLMAKKDIQTQITAIEGVPYFYKQLLVLQKKIHFSNLQHIGFGGDFVHDSLLKSLRKVYANTSFSIRYGISEIPSVVGLNTFLRLEENTNSYEIHPHYTITISDEILVSTTDTTSLIATGDVGAMHDGKLVIIDRKANFLKVKGYKIAPNYIEKVFLATEMIEDVQVFAKNDTLIAHIIPTKNYDKVNLKNYLQHQLPTYAVPDQIKEVATIERTRTGKIMRH
jgi:acyl-CoA synthetase (AMP-forming)/AMP-acid ligase II